MKTRKDKLLLNERLFALRALNFAVRTLEREHRLRIYAGVHNSREFSVDQQLHDESCTTVLGMARQALQPELLVVKPDDRSDALGADPHAIVYNGAALQGHCDRGCAYGALKDAFGETNRCNFDLASSLLCEEIRRIQKELDSE